MRPDITATEQSLYFDDFPLITIIREERRTARFSHRCQCCGTPIPPGEEYDYFFIRDDESTTGATFSSHQHVICPVPDDLICPITGGLR